MCINTKLYYSLYNCLELNLDVRSLRNFLFRLIEYNSPRSALFSLRSLVKMVKPIALLQFLQKFHQIIGIFPFQPNRKQYLTKWNRTIFLVSTTQFLFASTAFLMFDAKSIFDYGFGFCVLICIINPNVIYLIFIWQSENTLKFIENCEAFIEKSKCYS